MRAAMGDQVHTLRAGVMACLPMQSHTSCSTEPVRGAASVSVQQNGLIGVELICSASIHASYHKAGTHKIDVNRSVISK